MVNGFFTVNFPPEVVRQGQGAHLHYFGEQLRERLDEEFPPVVGRNERICRLNSFSPEKVVWEIEYIRKGCSKYKCPKCGGVFTTSLGQYERVSNALPRKFCPRCREEVSGMDAREYRIVLEKGKATSIIC